MREQSIQIIGDGPSGPLIYTIDKNGIFHTPSNGYVSSHLRLQGLLLASTVDGFVWVCDEGVWVLNSFSEAHTVVGGSGATVNVVVCPGAVAIGSGTAQLSAALDLTVTAPAKQFGTLIATPTQIFRGDAVGLDMSGTLTGLVGCYSMVLRRVQ